jgi:hypothetical protein
MDASPGGAFKQTPINPAGWIGAVFCPGRKALKPRITIDI